MSTPSQPSEAMQFNAPRPRRNNYGTLGNGLPSSPPLGTLPRQAPTTGSVRLLAPDLLRGLLMVLQSIDHSAMNMGAWRHGVAKDTESDSTLMHDWNPGRAWWARMLTHLCAPGFMFLLGMGTIYFTRSRRNLGWGTGQLVRHFFVRAAVLTLVNEVLGILLMPGLKLWMLNIVLVALAVNYFLAGLLCLAIRASEEGLTNLLAFWSQSRPIDLEQTQENEPLVSPRASSLSWHIHNALLLVLTAVTIWWNIWLSPHSGHCAVEKVALPSISMESIVAGTTAFTDFEPSKRGPWFDFWFYPMVNKYVLSGFPPLAWTSFAIMGVLYGRVLLARKWEPSSMVKGNLMASLHLALLFVATRLFHFGNLSEDCLHMPEHLAHPNTNQYLVSFKSFFYITKYPPSISFLAFTMSVNFFLLSFFGAIPSLSRLPGLMSFGSSALFFYAAHFVVYKLLSIPAKAVFGHRLPDDDPQTGEPAYGVGDTWAYWAFWVLGLVILEPLCRWYGRFKAAKDVDSVWRFF